MKVQLLLANQEVELTKQVQIPLNKTFQNTTNPTDIIVDYSKSINIPMTTTNNRILGNAYRLDKNIISNNGNDNIGMYLDPTKKIPFTLLYNGEMLMEGYAKFVSATYSSTNKFYTMNLFGLLGDFFQKMKDVVTSYDKLTDAQRESNEGIKYVLNDHLGHTSLNAEYVSESWKHTENNPNDFTDSSIIDQDIIGFAPAYRGLYGMDFKSSKVQVNETEIKSISEVLSEEWKDTYCLKTYGKVYDSCSDSQKSSADDYVDALGADDVIGDGLKDYQMDEYRSFHQQPYIYINKLIYMFKEKSKELTGYDLELDASWFNPDNPYWTKLVYTLNFLENIEELPSNTNTLSNQSQPMNLSITSTNECYGSGKLTFKFTPHSSVFNITSYVGDVEFKFDNRFTKLKFYDLRLADQAALVWKFTLTDANGNKQYRNVWYCSSDVLFSNGTNYTPPCVDSTYIHAGILFADTKDYNGKYTDYATSTYSLMTYKPHGLDFDIPKDLEDSEFTMEVETLLYSPLASPLRIRTNNQYPYQYNDIWHMLGYISSTTSTSLFAYKNNANNSLSMGLDVMYLDENPIFDIVLQYTKMFGLMWKMDDVNKKVTICRKSTYFKDYTIEDWSKKLDRSKDYIIEPITFESKYVNFNYEDVDGYKYSTYKDKYGIVYGAKKLKTSYEFDSNDTDLFDGIKPSLISQRKFVKYSDLVGWDLSSYITSKSDVMPRIESVDSDDTTAINNNAWYFRNDNEWLSKPVYITDDSDLMLENKESCWYKKSYLDSISYTGLPNVKPLYQLPRLSPVTAVEGQMFGCLFNCPNEDYTIDKSIKGCNGRYIYDNIWKDYINERYSINNKKLTAYFNIHPWEYMMFDFNKLVTIDNQLFMVNKIFDFDLNSTSTTKCELIQISDISAYAKDVIDFSPSNKSYILSVIASPANATITMNGVETNSIEVPYGTTVTWRVSCDGYVSQSGIHTVYNTRTLHVLLQKGTISPEKPDGNEETYTFTIEPTPSDAVVSINGIYTKSLEIANGETADWSVSKTGYITQTGLMKIVGDRILTVELVKETSTDPIIPSPDEPITPDPVYQFELLTTSENVDYAGGTKTLMYRSTKDDEGYLINDVVISGITGARIDSIEQAVEGTGDYIVTYYIPENLSGFDRKATITITHPNTGKVLSVGINQTYYIEPEVTQKVQVVINPEIYEIASRKNITYNLIFDATNYKGGTLSNVTVYLTDDYNGTTVYSYKSHGDVYVERGTKSETYIGILEGVTMLNPWVQVYYDGKLQYQTRAIQASPLPGETERT